MRRRAVPRRARDPRRRRSDGGVRPDPGLEQRSNAQSRVMPLGRVPGTSATERAAAWRARRASPWRKNASRSLRSRLVSTTGVASSGSRRASTGAIGPSRKRRSLSTPAFFASYAGAWRAGSRWNCERVAEPRVGAVVEEGRLQRQVPERRRAELVAVRGIAGHLLEAEVLVLRPGRRRPRCRCRRRRRARSAARRRRGFAKSLNISFAAPATAWQATQPPLPKKTSAPRFSLAVIAPRSPRAKRSIGASANVSVNSNSAIARPNIMKSIGPPAATLGKNAPKRSR